MRGIFAIDGPETTGEASREQSAIRICHVELTAIVRVLILHLMGDTFDGSLE
jgi:hypothetical protein